VLWKSITNYKLRITGRGARVWVGGHDIDAKRAIESLVAGCARPPAGPIEAAFVAPLDEDEALYFAAKVRPRLVDGGQLWIAGHAADRLAGPLLEIGYRAERTQMAASGASLVGYTRAGGIGS